MHHINRTHARACSVELERAGVRCYLRNNSEPIPADIIASGKRTYRSLSINGESFEFSEGFTELHTESYRRILNGEGFELEEARNAIQIVHDIRKQTPAGAVGDYHPFVKLPVSRHPFE